MATERTQQNGSPPRHTHQCYCALLCVLDIWVLGCESGLRTLQSARVSEDLPNKAVGRLGGKCLGGEGPRRGWATSTPLTPQSKWLTACSERPPNTIEGTPLTIREVGSKERRKPALT